MNRRIVLALLSAGVLAGCGYHAPSMGELRRGTSGVGGIPSQPNDSDAFYNLAQTIRRSEGEHRRTCHAWWCGVAGIEGGDFESMEWFIDDSNGVYAVVGAPRDLEGDDIAAQLARLDVRPGEAWGVICRPSQKEAKVLNLGLCEGLYETSDPLLFFSPDKSGQRVSKLIRMPSRPSPHDKHLDRSAVSTIAKVKKELDAAFKKGGSAATRAALASLTDGTLPELNAYAASLDAQEKNEALAVQARLVGELDALERSRELPPFEQLRRWLAVAAREAELETLGRERTDVYRKRRSEVGKVVAASLDREAERARKDGRVATAALAEGVARQLRGETTPSPSGGARALAGVVATLAPAFESEPALQAALDKTYERYFAKTGLSRVGLQLASAGAMRSLAREAGTPPTSVRVRVTDDRLTERVTTESRTSQYSGSTRNLAYVDWELALWELEKDVKRAQQAVDDAESSPERIDLGRVNTSQTQTQIGTDGNGRPVYATTTQRTYEEGQGSLRDNAVEGAQRGLDAAVRKLENHKAKAPPKMVDERQTWTFSAQVQRWEGQVTREVELRGGVSKVVTQTVRPSEEGVRQKSDSAHNVPSLDTFRTKDAVRQQLLSSLDARLSDELVAVMRKTLEERVTAHVAAQRSRWSSEDAAREERLLRDLVVQRDALTDLQLLAR